MTLLVTCGPAWEPLDRVRRLTNASTGQLGTRLADAFAISGHRVIVCRGEGATAPPPSRAARILPFTTNDDLAETLARLAATESVDAVLHAAALCDFKFGSVRDDSGNATTTEKIPSRGGRLVVELVPASKVLPRMRGWFPRARIVGWKLEMEGGPDDALRAAWRQLGEAGTDACVVNGAAWGPGFGFCTPPASVLPCADVDALVTALEAWLAR